MRRRTTVLYLITDLPRDGAQRQLLELVKGIDKHRFSPILLTLQSGGSMEREFKQVPGLRVMSLSRRGKYDFFCLLRVVRVLRRMKVRVVQPFLTPATFFGLLPALMCRIPVKVVTERAGPVNTSSGWGYRFYLRVEDFLSRWADWVVANSQAGGDYVVDRGIKPSRVRVIHNGIDLNRLSARDEEAEQVRQELGLAPGGQVVGMMARMYPVKNHAMFLQAAALVDKEIPGAKFVLLGDGPERGQLEVLSRELGLDSKVVFLGERRDVGTYLSAMDIVAHTSDTEGCSNSLLEAMALGKPVVATDVGGNKEVVQHGKTGLLVPPRNAEAFAENLVALLKDSSKARAMGRAAAERVVTEFGLEGMVRRYQSLYEETLTKRSGQGGSSVAGKRAAREMLLLCATSRMEHATREQIARLLRGPMDWEYLRDLSGFHDVAPLVAHYLSANGFSGRVPKPWLGWLTDVHNHTLYRNLILSAEVPRVLSHFDENGIEAIPLKGSVLAATIYDHPALRSMADIDVLVRERDVSRARACLAEIGYETTALEKLLAHSFHGTPFLKSQGFPVVLEVHWGLVDGRLATLPYEQIWDRAVPLQLGGVATETLSPEDNLLFLSYHLTKHDSGLLKFLCDIAEFIKWYGETLDWNYIRDGALSWEVEFAVYFSLKRAQEVLGAPVPAWVLEDLRPGATRRWLLGLLAGRDMFVSPMRGEKMRSETLALARALTMKRFRRPMMVLAEHRGSGKSGTWVRTAGWAALVIAYAFGRRLVGDRTIPKTRSW